VLCRSKEFKFILFVNKEVRLGCEKGLNPKLRGLIKFLSIVF
jgi:hypothetical protein